MHRFQLWFPFTPATISVAEDEVPHIHNRTFAEVLAALARAGMWRCEQIYLSDRHKPYLVQGAVPCRFFPVSFRWKASSRRYAYQWSLSALRRLLLTPPDAMAIFNAYGLFPKALALVATLRRVPYIVIVGGWYNRISRSQRWYYDHAFRVLVHTDMQKQALVDTGYHAGNIEIFPLGIDTKRFSPKPQSCYEPRDDWPRLLYVGRLQQSKGPFEAIQVFDVVRTHYPRAKLKVVGPITDEAFMKRMQTYVCEHQLQDSVVFVGRVAYEELPRYYQDADLFLFPSPYEGLPSVVLESMACGTPPIVLRGSGGTEEAVIHGEVGWVVDMPRLAYDVLQILADPVHLRRAGENAVERIRKTYSFQRTYSQMSQILEAATVPNRKVRAVERDLTR